MKLKIIFVFIISLFLTGCFLDPYTNSKYGNLAVESWYSYKTDDDDIGKVRRKVENIYQIDDVNCNYVTKYKSNYIFKCLITYKENSGTIIPFSESKELNVYAVFTPNNNDEFTYKVYNSSSEKGIWEKDEELK